jgi:hypothetical protein
MYLVEKKPTRVDRLQYKIIITKYLNIGSFSIKHEHVHKVVVKNGSCITSHNKKLFKLNILENNYRFH